MSTDKEKQKLWRAWRFLCEHTAASCAADAVVAAAAAATSYRSEDAGDIGRRSSQADASEAFSMGKSKGHSREEVLRKVVSDGIAKYVARLVCRWRISTAGYGL